jgi:hypothetical protein
MNLWMNECHMNFASSYKFMCQMCFQCMKLTKYEWRNYAQFSLLNHKMLNLWCKSSVKRVQGCINGNLQNIRYKNLSIP